MTDLEERVTAFVVEETGIRRKRVYLASRLSQDIGMDGDDAVDFFRRFGEEFQVDLTALGEHWDRHFLPEGGAPAAGCMVAIGAGAIAGALLHEAFKWIPAWVSMLSPTAVFSWIYSRFFVERDRDRGTTPVTVQDLVDAARSGKWVKQDDVPVASLFRTIE
jgi:hypothetical protein